MAESCVGVACAGGKRLKEDPQDQTGPRQLRGASPGVNVIWRHCSLSLCSLSLRGWTLGRTAAGGTQHDPDLIP